MPKQIKMSAASQAAFLASLPARLTTLVVAAERENIKDGAAALVAASSGTYTEEDLYKAGHPYSRRAPQVAYDPSIINAQTGEFRDGWKAQEPEATTESDMVQVVTKCPNFDPKAQFMRGTPLMVRRPVILRASMAIAASRKARIQRAIQTALTPGDTP